MLRPGARIGIIGGGQLGRMMAFSAKEMGFEVGVLDPTPNCPAGQVSDWQIQAPYSDVGALQELALWADVLTYEFENVDASALDQVVGEGQLPQGTDLLRVTQDRRAEKRFLSKAGIPVAPYRIVNQGESVAEAAKRLGFPCVLKTARGGYDGKGQVVLQTQADLLTAQTLADQADCVLESFVSFQGECSVIVVGGTDGSVAAFPPIANEHRNNILHLSTIPAKIESSTTDEALRYARRIAADLGLAGALAIEMFYTKEGSVLVNELAPRPHNSGHVTIEACDFNQFDLHIRGVCGWPLPAPTLLSPAVMVNILGEHVEGAIEQVAKNPNWHLHLYGKEEAKIGRKMGHLTLLGDPSSAVAAIEGSAVWQ